MNIHQSFEEAERHRILTAVCQGIAAGEEAAVRAFHRLDLHERLGILYALTDPRRSIGEQMGARGLLVVLGEQARRELEGPADRRGR